MILDMMICETVAPDSSMMLSYNYSTGRVSQSILREKRSNVVRSSTVVEINHTLASLTVGFGHTFNLILLLDGIRVGRSTRRVDELFCETFGHGLEVTEGSFTRSRCNQVQGVVDTSKGRHIDGLTSDHTRTSDTGRVLTGSGIDNGIDDDLHGVLVREQVNDFQRVLDNSDRQEFLSTVAALAHETTHQSFDDGARCLAEALLLVAARRVRQVRGVVALARNVILLLISTERERERLWNETLALASAYNILSN
jgi:hypothetical protein